MWFLFVSQRILTSENDGIISTIIIIRKYGLDNQLLYRVDVYEFLFILQVGKFIYIFKVGKFFEHFTFLMCLC